MSGNVLVGDILEEVRSIPVVDAHEHLPPESVPLGERRDFYSLFQHYCAAELVSAGATPEDMAAFADRNVPLPERWARFRPFYAAIRTGGYARAARIAIRDLLGFRDLNDETYEGVSRRLQEITRPGLYDYVLRERCGISACIECWSLSAGKYPDYFFDLALSSEVVDLQTQPALERLAARCKRSIHTMADALDCMTQTVETWRANPRVVGVKSGHAYTRTLHFQRVSRQDAEAVLARALKSGKDGVPAPDAGLLQDFLMFELLARLEAAGLPMVFHTGLQAGNRNRIANANPLLLQTVLEQFPRLRIDLFHGGMPWVREIAVLAKYFPGVHLNMAWMHIINPAQARAALSEWLDMVPNTKIFGFGGDYHIVEKVYGHLVMARQNVAQVLAEKVAEGAISRVEAGSLARRLMFDNANEFYRIAPHAAACRARGVVP